MRKPVINLLKVTPNNYLVRRNQYSIGTIERISDDVYHLIVKGEDCGYWATYADCVNQLQWRFGV